MPPRGPAPVRTSRPRFRPSARRRYAGRLAWLVATAAALSIAAVRPAAALVRRPEEDPGRRVIPRALVDQVPVDAPEGGAGPGAAAADAFRRRHAGRWQVTFDRRTGRAAFIEGEGVPFLPGRGNGLDAAALGFAAAPRGLADIEARGRAFLDGEGDLLRPDAGDLTLDEGRSAWLEEGRVVFLDWNWSVDGVPVEGARVFLRVNNGNIVQAGSVGISSGAPKAHAVLDADEALGRLVEHAGGARPGDRVTAAPSLLFIARAAGRGDAVAWGAGVSYRLVWRAAFRRAAGRETWTGDVDAATGEIVAFEDANRYARVTGGIHPRTVSDPEEVRVLPSVRLFAGGASLTTGDGGTFTYSSGPAFAPLDGGFFRIVCEGCTSPDHAFAFAGSGTGDLHFGTGGADQVGNGLSTPAERDAFFHQNRVRSLAKKWLSIAWLNTTVTSNVNIQDVCNAFWDGSATNFFRSGSGCNNTGEISDVMYHEWGHGLDQNTNLGDGSTGEATGDITALHVTHDAIIGPDFDVNGTPVRILDSSRAGFVATVAGLDSFCTVCVPGQCTNGPFGHEVHCEGEIYGQAQWDLAQSLVARYGFNTGWQTSERIYFLSLPQNNTMVPTSSQSTYSAYLAVDDDDGNLANGTPDCSLIDAAFRTHGIAGTACSGNTTPCARPAQPSITVTPSHGKVVLDWTATGVTTYRVMRADFSPTPAYMLLSQQSGTHFEDTTVQPGVTYWYVVEALTAAGCRSTIENPAAASASPDARPEIASVAIDDTPAGNRSGFPDPGESIDVTAALVNVLPAGAGGPEQGTMTTSTPNATVTIATATYGALSPGGAPAGGTAYRVALNSSIVCGQDVALGLSVNGGDGGPATPASFPVLVGQRQVRYFENFNAPTTWTTVAGSPAATGGLWVQGTPNATTWQPGHDADGGGGCLFTGVNTDDATGDVDGGETIALSPVIDLSGATAARLSYKRWWADSSLTDAGDALVVEVSGNGGSTWVTAETVGAAARNLGWQPVDVRLETLVPLNSSFRIRVRAKDAAPDTNVEAAIDDVKVETVTCDLTPPCFTAPSFAGLATAAPGASCGETDLAWSAGTTHCTNAQVTYDVYRSTSAGFTPGPATLVASRLPALSFHDTLLLPGAAYHYIVRAYDSRSGEDGNLVERTVTATASPDTVAPVFAGLGSAASGAGCGQTLLSWSPAAESCSTPVHYDVYRSTSPGFTPGPANLVAQVLGTSYMDSALAAAQTYYYVVRAADSRGNEETNLVARPVAATVLPLVIYNETFEAGAGGWARISPESATTGLWELGDPEPTTVQPGDDATPPPGVNAWITGLAAGANAGDNDVDGGVTTLASGNIDLKAQPSPVLQLTLFYSNDGGANPGEDPLLVDLSSDGGTTWTNVLSSLADIPAWTPTQFPIAGVVPITSQFRIRVTAEDLGVGGSLVEAGVDDVSVFQPGAGCGVCTGTVGGVGTIQVTRSGGDVVLDWSADPVSAPSYEVYLRTGAALGTGIRIGSTTTKSFVHAGAALLTGDNFFYDVTAVDVCGRESSFP